MNKKRRIASALALAGMTMGAAGLVGAQAAFGAPAAGSGYGAGAVYQVELSSNVTGEGFWIWAALSPGGTGNYQETDCIHLGGGHATDAAAHDAGDVSGWSVSSNGVLTIPGVEILGGLETATVSVTLPASGYGTVGAMTITVTSSSVVTNPPIPVGPSFTLPAHGEVAP
jgi:hypothetical protein